MLVILIAETVLILWLLMDGSFPVWLSVACYWKDNKAVLENALLRSACIQAKED